MKRLEDFSKEELIDFINFLMSTVELSCNCGKSTDNKYGPCFGCEFFNKKEDCKEFVFNKFLFEFDLQREETINEICDLIQQITD